MDMPPESGLDVRPFLAVTAWLRAGRFSAPEVLGADARRGLVLLEDLGDDLFRHALRRPTDVSSPASTARRRRGARRPAAPPAAGSDVGWTPPPYDMAFLMREARAGAGAGPARRYRRACSAGSAAEYEALTDAAFAPVAAAPPVPVLRDYHAENLIWLPNRRGHARVGMLDYQDMLLGHPGL